MPANCGAPESNILPVFYFLRSERRILPQQTTFSRLTKKKKKNEGMARISDVQLPVHVKYIFFK